MCWSAMNFGITWIGYTFFKSNKMGKEGNFGIKIEYISMLKKFNFSFYLDKKKPKSMQIFSYLNNQFSHMSKKKLISVLYWIK